jgi:hypothetical protein
LKIEVVPISSLEEIASNAEREVNDNFSLNYIASHLISVTNLKQKPLEDVTEEAIRWAAREKPEELQINHGQHIKDGLEHIISELQHKKTSNRALFSLLAQEDISDTGDNPIPSFMLMQCNIHEDVLYCTSYFRALEVSKFLRINLEELRLKICEIHKSIPEFQSVNITIFAFRAYKKRNINTLTVPEIDRINPIEIFTTLFGEPKKVAAMLREKSLPSTVINTDSIKNLIVSVEKGACKNFNTRLITQNASEAISVAETLLKLRQRSSHHPEIESLNLEFHNKIIAIAEELEK